MNIEQQSAPLFPSRMPQLQMQPWHNRTLDALYAERVRQQCEAGSDSPLPPTPEEIGSLIGDGRLCDASIRLSSLVSPHEIATRWIAHHKTPTVPSAIPLTDIIEHPGVLDLRPEEVCVLKIVRAVSEFGLNSDLHVGGRALELVLPFRDELDKELDPYYQGTRSTESYRTKGVASLLAAVASFQEQAQPCGIEVLAEAKEAKTPAIMVTSHHSLGGDAVPLVAEFSKRHELLNGRIDCARKGYWDHRENDLRWGLKDSLHFWESSFQRLAEKSHDSSSWLVVEDGLDHPIYHQPNLTVADVIRAAYTAVTGHDPRHLRLARDLKEAHELMAHSVVSGVVTDLYFPDSTGSKDKSRGMMLFGRTVAPFIGTREAQNLLAAARAVESRVRSVVIEEFNHLRHAA